MNIEDLWEQRRRQINARRKRLANAEQERTRQAELEISSAF
jgi:macrodomain Ter protein organizer (MatP/YcbG family)